MEKQKTKRYRAILDQEEDIEVKPSTELIPDQYERQDNENMLVYFFTPNKQKNEFSDLLTEIGYTPIICGLDCVNRKDTRNNTLKKISANAKGKDGLILLFAKAFLNQADLSEIWSSFSSANCPDLQNKPKIFIFQVSSKTARDAGGKTDSLPFNNQYDTPSEGDMMIVYEKLSANEESRLIPELTKNIRLYGQREDFTSLATYYSDSDDEQKQSKNTAESRFLISTLTRKFFFVPAEHRGHHHSIAQTHKKIEKTLKDLKKAVENHKITMHEQKNGGNKNITEKLSLSFRSNKTPNISPKAKKSKDKFKEEETDPDKTMNEKLHKETERAFNDKGIKSEEVNQGATSSKETYTYSPTHNLTPKLARTRKGSTVSTPRKNKKPPWK